jgi:hypothetical protein
MAKLIRDAQRAAGALALAAVLAAGGCADDDPGIPAADAGGATGGDASFGDDAAGPGEGGPAAWFFTSNASQNAWHVAIVSPDADSATVIEVGDLADLSGPAGNDLGPSWGDAVASGDGTRVFANATSVQRIAVFDAADRSFEALVTVGERPLHMYRPTPGGAIWSHSDGEGAFYVVNEQTLAVGDPVVKSLSDTGHGKLLYAEQLGRNYYATNTNDPGAWFIDATGDGAPSTELLPVCQVPCDDGGGGDHDHAHGPGTHDDHEDEVCGGTHDAGYNPALGYAIFECSGASRGYYGFVDTENNEVVRRGDDEGDDLFEITGALAKSPGNEYILVISAGAASDQVKIWDTGAQEHDGIAFDGAVTVGDAPSARGTVFWQNGDGDWEAWIPQSAGEHVAIVNLRTLDVELVDIGPVSAPDGAAHFSRQGAIGGGYFFSHNDDGAVIVELETREVLPAVALPGPAARLVFVDPTDD